MYNTSKYIVHVNLHWFQRKVFTCIILKRITLKSFKIYNISVFEEKRKFLLDFQPIISFSVKCGHVIYLTTIIYFLSIQIFWAMALLLSGGHKTQFRCCFYIHMYVVIVAIKDWHNAANLVPLRQKHNRLYRNRVLSTL